MNRLKVGNLQDIRERQSRIVHVHGMEIALFRLSNGSVKAIENRCPHKGGPLSEGIICDHIVFCPLHDWQVNLNNGKVMEPDTGCVTKFEVEIDDESGDIYILMKENAGMISSH